MTKYFSGPIFRQILVKMLKVSKKKLNRLESPCFMPTNGRTRWQKWRGLTVFFHNCFAEETKRSLAFYWKFLPRGLRTTVLSYSGMPYSLSYSNGQLWRTPVKQKVSFHTLSHHTLFLFYAFINCACFEMNTSVAMIFLYKDFVFNITIKKWE
jgi:hypothetical protein